MPYCCFNCQFVFEYTKSFSTAFLWPWAKFLWSISCSSVCLSVCLCVWGCVCVCVCLSVRVFVCVSVCLCDLLVIWWCVIDVRLHWRHQLRYNFLSSTSLIVWLGVTWSLQLLVMLLFCVLYAECSYQGSGWSYDSSCGRLWPGNKDPWPSVCPSLCLTVVLAISSYLY